MRLASLDARGMGADGRAFWITIGGAVGDGRPPQILTSRELIARQRAEQLERDRRDILELIAADRPLSEVMNRIVQLVERQTDECQAMMTILSDGQVLMHAPSLASPLVQELQTGLLPLASSLTGQAWESTCCVGTSDIESDPQWAPVRQTALAMGLARCWTTPIVSEENTPHGAISLLCRHKRVPSEREAGVLAMVSRLAALSIERNDTTLRLAYMARHDRLTGLPNRLQLELRADEAIAQAQRAGRQLALLALDLDRFKQVNDTLGHEAGDQLLQTVARRLRERLRAGDTIARIGGDEFIILLPEVGTPAHAQVVAAKLIESLSEPIELATGKITVGASIGIAIYPTDGADRAALERKADAALYRAKGAGRAGWSL